MKKHCFAIEKSRFFFFSVRTFTHYWYGFSLQNHSENEMKWNKQVTQKSFMYLLLINLKGKNW